MLSRYGYTPEAGPGGGEGLSPEQEAQLNSALQPDDLDGLPRVVLYDEGTDSYPARPDVPNGMVTYKGPVAPADWMSLDDWLPTV